MRGQPAGPAERLPAAGSARWLPWLLFGPLAGVVGLRWVLTWLADRTPVVAWPLRPFAGAQDPVQGVWSMAWGVAAVVLLCAVVWLARKRWGAARVRPVMAVLWCAVCAVAAGFMLRSHANVQALQAVAPVTAQVQGLRMQAPSLRGPGGSLLVVQTDDAHVPQAPQQVLIESLDAAALKPGDRIRLLRADGRFSGQFVTGWERLEPLLQKLP